MLLPWITQVIAQVSPHTQDNDVRLKMTHFEMRLGVNRGGVDGGKQQVQILVDHHQELQHNPICYDH